jgi:hypothetical protein
MSFSSALIVVVIADEPQPPRFPSPQQFELLGLSLGFPLHNTNRVIKTTQWNTSQMRRFYVDRYASNL